MNPTVMIVDDQASICDVVHATLEIKGYHCLPFVDAKAALAYLRDTTNHQPEVIFLDYMMPEYNGRMFLQALEQDKIRHRYYIILLSAAQNLEPLKEELGCDAILSKPFSLSVLHELVKTAAISLQHQMSTGSAHLPENITSHSAHSNNDHEAK